MAGKCLTVQNMNFYVNSDFNDVIGFNVNYESEPDFNVSVDVNLALCEETFVNNRCILNQGAIDRCSDLEIESNVISSQSQNAIPVISQNVNTDSLNISHNVNDNLGNSNEGNNENVVDGTSTYDMETNTDAVENPYDDLAKFAKNNSH